MRTRMHMYTYYIAHTNMQTHTYMCIHTHTQSDPNISIVSRVTMVSDWCTKLAVFFSKPPAAKLEVRTHQLSLE